MEGGRGAWLSHLTASSDATNGDGDDGRFSGRRPPHLPQVSSHKVVDGWTVRSTMRCHRCTGSSSSSVLKRLYSSNFLKQDISDYFTHIVIDH